MDNYYRRRMIQCIEKREPEKPMTSPQRTELGKEGKDRSFPPSKQKKTDLRETQEWRASGWNHIQVLEQLPEASEGKIRTKLSRMPDNRPKIRDNAKPRRNSVHWGKGGRHLRGRGADQEKKGSGTGKKLSR